MEKLKISKLLFIHIEKELKNGETRYITRIYDVSEYPEKRPINITEEMHKIGFSVFGENWIKKFDIKIQSVKLKDEKEKVMTHTIEKNRSLDFKPEDFKRIQREAEKTGIFLNDGIIIDISKAQKIIVGDEDLTTDSKKDVISIIKELNLFPEQESKEEIEEIENLRE